MEDIQICKLKIIKEIKQGKKLLLMLDFDGTLAKITKPPKPAILEESTRNLLKTLSEKFPVAIISGRELHNIEEKVGLQNLIYAGNHGLDWKFNGEYASKKFDFDIQKKISDIEKNLEKIKNTYLGIEVQNKKSTLAIHYRLLDKKLIKKCIKEVDEVLSFAETQKHFLVMKGKKVVELCPKIDWNKGFFAKFILETLEKQKKCKMVPIFVGDDTSDENAFSLLNDGITIRVGKKKNSMAKYYLKNQAQVDNFLCWLTESKLT